MDIITGPGKYKDEEGTVWDIGTENRTPLGSPYHEGQIPNACYVKRFLKSGKGINTATRIVSRIDDPEWKAGDECEALNINFDPVDAENTPHRYIGRSRDHWYVVENSKGEFFSTPHLRRPVKRREWKTCVAEFSELYPGEPALIRFTVVVDQIRGENGFTLNEKYSPAILDALNRAEEAK